MLERKVMWIEGMFLRPHHFQQQDRRTESLVASRVAALQPFFWGFSHLRLDETELSTGTIAVRECEGAFADGVAFAFPGDGAVIPPVSVDVGLANTTVHLVAPALAPGSALGAPRDPETNRVPARYVIENRESDDVMNPNGTPELLQLGEQNLRLHVGDDLEPGSVALPLARIREVTTDRRVVLDDSFIPPVLSAHVSPELARPLREVERLFHARADSLAGRYSTAGGASVAAQEQFMRLQVCNRWAARLGQICEARGSMLSGDREGQPRIHPAELHRDLIEAAADLACFTRVETRRPPEDLPPYDHDHLTAVMHPVLAEIRRSLGFLGEQKAVPIKLEIHPKTKIRYNRSIDQRLFKDTDFILVAKSQMLQEDFRRNLPSRVSVGSVDEIMEIIGAAERSVPLVPLSTNPPDLNPLSGYTYFRLDQNAEAWAGIARHQSIAIHAQDVFEDLDMMLWAIRN